MQELLIDPVRIVVVSLRLKKEQSLLSGGSLTEPSEECTVLLSSLRQISDVVLVHDQAAVTSTPIDERYGYIKLVGMPVETSFGKQLGRVSCP